MNNSLHSYEHSFFNDTMPSKIKRRGKESFQAFNRIMYRNRKLQLIMLSVENRVVQSLLETKLKSDTAPEVGGERTVIVSPPPPREMFKKYSTGSKNLIFQKSLGMLFHLKKICTARTKLRKSRKSEK